MIISAGICDKQGMILLARTFTPISKHTLQEYYHSFPKLIQANQQHTFVVNQNLRFIYQPIENYYLLLITQQNSNIIQDIELLKLLQKVLVDIIPYGLTNELINQNQLEIILAFDDTVSLGQKDSISLVQIQNTLQMESTEEKLHIMLQKAKQNEAKENAKKHQLEVERKRQEQKMNSQYNTITTSQSMQLEKLQQAAAQSVNFPMASDEQIDSLLTNQSEKSQVKTVLSKSTVPKKGMQLKKKTEH